MSGLSIRWVTFFIKISQKYSKLSLKLFNLANFPSKIYVTQPTDDPIQYFDKKLCDLYNYST